MVQPFLCATAGPPPLIILGLSTGLMERFALVILTFQLCSPQGKKARWKKEEDDAEPVGWNGFRNEHREDFWLNKLSVGRELALLVCLHQCTTMFVGLRP